jgi:hypothetical protein
VRINKVSLGEYCLKFIWKVSNAVVVVVDDRERWRVKAKKEV